MTPLLLLFFEKHDDAIRCWL